MSRSKDILEMFKNAAILFAITLVAGVLLGVVYEVTKDPIARQEELTVQNACREVFADADHFDKALQMYSQEVIDEAAAAGVTYGDIFKAVDNSNKVLGYVLTVTSSQGYGGDIQIMMGVTAEGTLNGISIIKISETAGLGMQAGEVLVPQFADKQVSEFVYTKSGAENDNEIDAISGATITTKAVTNAVNCGLAGFRDLTGGGR